MAPELVLLTHPTALLMQCYHVFNNNNNNNSGDKWFRIQEIFINVLAEEHKCQLQAEVQKHKYEHKHIK